MDPVLLRLGPWRIGSWDFGPLEIRWYGFMYLLGFAAAYLVIRSELKRKRGPIPYQAADDLLFYLIVGLLVGARFGYALFYNLPSYAAAPWEILFLWHGGMSFHGGLVGMVVAGWIFARSRNVLFLDLADIGALAAPIGLLLGRVGNFINCELFGRVTTVPWGVVFVDGGPLSRHPSQLYEAFFEGLVLFILLWRLRTKTRRHGQILGIFLMCYGVFRFFIEFFREPDVQLGFISYGLTMGQVLCLAMIVASIGLFIYIQCCGTVIASSKPAE
jgi:phosphatidylglycerol:prolipoprotein diacylglycerol transferase